MLNWIEIRPFSGHVDNTNANGCQHVLSGPGCMTRDIVRNASILYMYRDSRGCAESGAVEGHQFDISERSGYSTRNGHNWRFLCSLLRTL